MQGQKGKSVKYVRAYGAEGKEEGKEEEKEEEGRRSADHLSHRRRGRGDRREKERE